MLWYVKSTTKSYQNSKSTSSIHSRPMLNWLEYSPRNQCLYHWKFDLIDVRQSSLHFYLLLTLQFPQPASKIRPIGVSHDIYFDRDWFHFARYSQWNESHVRLVTPTDSLHACRLQFSESEQYDDKAMTTTYANHQHFMSTSIFPVEWSCKYFTCNIAI